MPALRKALAGGKCIWFGADDGHRFYAVRAVRIRLWPCLRTSRRNGPDQGLARRLRPAPFRDWMTGRRPPARIRRRAGSHAVVPLPMNAPCPPPTMPSRMGPWCFSVRVALTIAASIASLRLQAKHGPDLVLIHGSAREIIRAGAARQLNDMIGDEGRAFGSALIGRFQAAFPFQHRPAVIAVLGEF